MRVSLVVAVADNGVIGRDDGSIPWRVRTDVRRYKAMTMGHPIVMGRKTWDSLGKALPGRVNIVVTRAASPSLDGAVVVNSIEDALQEAEKTGTDEAMVIGGGAIYKAALPYSGTIHLTRVHATPEGEVTFDFEPSEWHVEWQEHHDADPANEDMHAFTFQTLRRRSE